MLATQPHSRGGRLSQRERQSPSRQKLAWKQIQSKTKQSSSLYLFDPEDKYQAGAWKVSRYKSGGMARTILWRSLQAYCSGKYKPMYLPFSSKSKDCHAVPANVGLWSSLPRRMPLKLLPWKININRFIWKIFRSIKHSTLGDWWFQSPSAGRRQSGVWEDTYNCTQGLSHGEMWSWVGHHSPPTWGNWVFCPHIKVEEISNPTALQMSLQKCKKHPK